MTLEFLPMLCTFFSTQLFFFCFHLIFVNCIFVKEVSYWTIISLYFYFRSRRADEFASAHDSVWPLFAGKLIDIYKHIINTVEPFILNCQVTLQ